MSGVASPSAHPMAGYCATGRGTDADAASSGHGRARLLAGSVRQGLGQHNKLSPELRAVFLGRAMARASLYTMVLLNPDYIPPGSQSRLLSHHGPLAVFGLRTPGAVRERHYSIG